MNIGLLFTLLSGLFIVLGAVIVYFTKSNKKIEHFSIGVAFSVMIGLILFDLIPEEYELFRGQFKTFYLILLIICTILVGFGILKLLDRFIPDHHDHEEEDRMMHIGIVSTIAIIIHNVIEGMALYSSSSVSTKTGLMLMIGIGLHNIPMGMIIASSFKNKTKRLIALVALCLSTFIGGFILFLLKNINYCIEGILLGVTSGMLVYISFMELLPMIIKTKKEKSTVTGVFVGLILLFVATFL